MQKKQVGCYIYLRFTTLANSGNGHGLPLKQFLLVAIILTWKIEVKETSFTDLRTEMTI